jgi:hypothetical protein
MTNCHAKHKHYPCKLFTSAGGFSRLNEILFIKEKLHFLDLLQVFIVKTIISDYIFYDSNFVSYHSLG